LILQSFPLLFRPPAFPRLNRLGAVLGGCILGGAEVLAGETLESGVGGASDKRLRSSSNGIRSGTWLLSSFIAQAREERGGFRDLVFQLGAQK